MSQKSCNGSTFVLSFNCGKVVTNPIEHQQPKMLDDFISLGNKLDLLRYQKEVVGKLP